MWRLIFWNFSSWCNYCKIVVFLEKLYEEVALQFQGLLSEENLEHLWIKEESKYREEYEAVGSKANIVSAKGKKKQDGKEKPS